MPAALIALIIILFLGVLLLVTYFSAAVAFRLLKGITGTLEASSLPYPVKRSLNDSKRYADLVRKTVQQYPPGPMRDRLSLTVKPVDEWLANLNRLEQALTKLYTQRNLPREVRQVTLEIEQLHRQLLMAGKEEAASVRALIASKKKHCAALKELQSFQNQAELKIRKIASDLGATHAEMLLVTAKGDFNDNRMQRLDENLQDHVTSLHDMLSAMDEMGYSSVT